MEEKPIGRSCHLCGPIPDFQKVELLHGKERLPEQVGRLERIAGSGVYGAEELRVCRACGCYFLFLHDHDSEAGMGEGYSDEAITRIDTDRALRELDRLEREAHASELHWGSPAAAGYGTVAERFRNEAREELVRIGRERMRLNGQGCGTA
ncbi:MAG TPA: hypothetical protein PLP29_15235 [Candidatus Ozemobacteraceae bacterium]|nr:hypothetical protein [Candidatus Ozemobacteraceae bacterium]